MADKPVFYVEVIVVADSSDVLTCKMVLERATMPDVYSDDVKSIAQACLKEAQKEHPSCIINRVRVYVN